ncbi:MAG: sulfatase-like hydrolase/transferase [bacterium]|nr:sulfatase-like hydrolase/transferase [bacterium]
MKTSPLFDGLHLALLASLAFAQPLYDILGKHPQFFLVRQLAVPDLFLFLIVLSVLIPLPFFLAPWIVAFVERVTRSSEARDSGGESRLRRVVFLSLAGLLIVLIVLPLVDKIPNLLGYAKLGLALLLGTGGAILLGRFAILRSFLSYLSPAMLVFPLLFWMTSAAYSIAAAQSGSRAVAPQISATNPVVFVVLDEFPMLSLLDANRDIDRKRFPNFAALADQAHWFRDATTIESITATAVPAIITGRYSKTTGVGVALYSEAPENIFSLLSRQYELRIFEVATRLAPPEQSRQDSELEQSFGDRFTELLDDTALVYVNLILPSGIRVRYPELSAGLMEIFIRADVQQGQMKAAANPLAAIVQNFQGASADALKEMREAGIPDWRLYQYRQFLSAIDDRPRSFYFVHSLFPHIPFRFSHTGNYYSNDVTLAGWDPEQDAWHDEEAPVLLAYRRHLMQVAYTDRLFGRLIARLKAAGIYDDAIIVVTADHGISFRPGRSRRDPDETNHHEIANVPLLIKLPGQKRGRIDDRPVQTIDIVPSVATALGIDMPWAVDGRSLFEDDGQGGFRASDAYTQDEAEAVGGPVVRRIGHAEFTTTFAETGGPALQRQLELFGTGDNGFALRGPHDELVGQPVSGMTVVAETNPECAFRLKDAANYERVRPASGAIPAYITGGLGCILEWKQAAIAVNGVVQATVETFPGYAKQMSVAAMVPEQSFRAGFNSVEVYLIEPTAAGQVQLRQIRRPEASP